MKLRPYQEEFVRKVEEAFQSVDKCMGVAATGAGKTILASELMSKHREPGHCLFLADAQELVHQNTDKFQKFTGEKAGVEMGEQHAVVGRHRVTIATSQSMFRRLDKYPEDFFNRIIVDECHANTLGEMSMKVLSHFHDYAKVLGVTATPFRSDRKNLGDYYESIAVEIGLDRLIREGFLSRIMIKSIPMPVDLSKIGTAGGDYKTSDLGEVIEPILKEAAKQLIEHSADRKKIVIFLPLIKTSIRMTRILNEMGVKAVHVSGEDKEAMREFTHGDARVICNAQLLTTGWDCPAVDCVLVLRPTKSLALYQQCIGRGTRIAEGKDKLLLLDPLYLSDDHRLITPARLVARDEEQAKAMREHIEEEGGGDLLEMEEDVEQKRAEALRAIMEKKAKRQARVVDAMEFALNCGDMETAEFQPEFGWESAPPSPKQIAALENAGFDTDEIDSRGKASKVLDLLFLRRQKGLATPKQLRLLKRHGHPSPSTATFEEASQWIDQKMAHFKSGRGGSQPGADNTLPTSLLIRLRKAGLRPKDYKSVTEANSALSQLV